jgi:glycosyltransferase involved in cell wall biosynthesis
MMVLIPAFNEEGAICHLVTGIKKVVPEVDIVVFDDCSTDRTAQLAAEAGAAVVRLPSNLGIGGAVQTGLKFACEHNYDSVIRLDGDGQHDPEAIPHLLAALRAGSADVVIGSRFLSGQNDVKISFTRRAGIKIFAFLVSVLTGNRETDTTSGFMCLNRAAVQVLADYLPQDYPEVEGRVILHKAALSTLEIPIKMRPRLTGSSSIGSWQSFYYALKVSIAVLICIMKDIPQVKKEVTRDTRSYRTTHRRYRRQPYSLGSDRPVDTETPVT